MIAEILDDLIKFDVFRIKHIHRHQGRHFHIADFFPHLLRTEFDPMGTVDGQDRRIGNPQSRKRFSNKIRIAGRIQDIQLTGLPFGIHRGGVNRDLPLLFIIMIIRNRASLFDASDSGDCTAAGKHRFGKDGFARRSMTDEGQVADG